ncbi:DeoR/GlpR family DNA-binding transcription regulator [Nocardia higoensis]|uniref:DeoR/GlpR family DNA-binding transcription regulator n=1 Tax=Nocardia higoensis TaxID=228599 RepID=UPI0003177738|nr:DeoR/GlpR family DNA-binding transcription regulator [Nocardia higoensis]
MTPGRGELPAQRQREIANYLLTRSTSTAQELAERFGVSLVTAHRDLDALARKGVVRKFHGGVTAQPSSVFESSIEYRTGAALNNKRAIAARAAQLVEPGMSVLLDSSTTNLHLLDPLETIRPLTLITNFVPVISRVAQWEEVRLMVLGGEYDARHASMHGIGCADAARRVRADIGFFSFAGIDEHGVYHQEQAVSASKTAMLGAATRRIVLADSSKIGRTALHWLAPLDDFEQLITDNEAPADIVDALRDGDIEVTVEQC